MKIKLDKSDKTDFSTLRMKNAPTRWDRYFYSLIVMYTFFVVSIKKVCNWIECYDCIKKVMHLLYRVHSSVFFKLILFELSIDFYKMIMIYHVNEMRTVRTDRKREIGRLDEKMCCIIKGSECIDLFHANAVSRIAAQKWGNNREIAA